MRTISGPLPLLFFSLFFLVSVDTSHAQWQKIPRWAPSSNSQIQVMSDSNIFYMDLVGLMTFWWANFHTDDDLNTFFGSNYPEYNYTSPQLRAIHFLDDTTGMWTQQDTVFTTYDRGVTKHAHSYDSSTIYPMALKMLDDSLGYLLHGNMILSKIRPGQMLHQHIFSNMSVFINTSFNQLTNSYYEYLEIPNPSTIFLSTIDNSKNESYLLKSSDSGKTWMTSYSESGILFVSSSFPDVMNGFLATDKNIRKTTDGGLTWSPLYNISHNNINSIYFHDPMVGYFTTDSFEVFRTVDGGISWYTDKPATNGPVDFAVIKTINKEVAYAIDFTGVWKRSASDILPVVHDIPDTTVCMNNPDSISFIIEDDHLMSSTLTVTSDNQVLLPNANITLSGIGNVRTILAVPKPKTTGSANIKVLLVDSLGRRDSTFFRYEVIDCIPSIFDIPDTTICMNDTLSNLTFKIEDDNLSTATLSASSDNQALLPDANISLAGNGNSRTITAIPLPDQIGFVNIDIVITDSIGQSGGTSFQLEVRKCHIGIHENGKLNYSIYPNPSSEGIFNLELVSKVDNLIVSVYNVKGELILQKENISSGKHQFDLSDEAGGVYIIELDNGSFNKREKVIFNH